MRPRLLAHAGPDHRPAAGPAVDVGRSAAAKRSLDLVASAAGLVLLSPALLAIAAAVRLEDGGPSLFAQERVGRRGARFRILKFRTMRAHPGGPLLTVGDDPRITRVGRFLRRHKLDELPQLWNVLRGEMSLVGPRPEVERYVREYGDRQLAVLDLTPGITDPASLLYLDEARVLAAAADPEAAYLRQVMPAKVELNLAYARRATLAADLGVVLRTLLRLVSRAADAAPAAVRGTPP